MDYEYFMDDLQQWELPLLTDNMHYTEKNGWEQTRFSSYCTLSPYFKKGQKKTITEFMPLETDPKETEKIGHEADEEEMQKMEQRAREFEKQLNAKKEFMN